VKATLHLREPVAAYRAFNALWQSIKGSLLSGQSLELEIRPARRSTEANSRMWAMLNEVSQQVDWHGNRLTPDEWKDVFTSALKRQKVVPGIDGGFVVIGARTSRMSSAEISELMELMSAFGAERGVEFREPEVA
jgi:hypothetical protein